MNEVLSSELLERQFGPTELEIMFQDEGSRIIATKTVGDGRVLEVSWVVFAADAAERFSEPYRGMLQGESMGKAFQTRGIEFHRRVNTAYSYDLPEAFNRWFGETQDATVIGLSILAGPEQRHFAEILETYRPGVRWPSLEGEPTPDETRQISLLANFLETVPKAS